MPECECEVNMEGCISVINSGSSSIKFSLYDRVEDFHPRLLFSGQIEGISISPYFSAKDYTGSVIAEKRWQKGEAHDHRTLLDFLINWIRRQRLELGLHLLGVGHRVVHGGNHYTKPVVIDEDVLTDLEQFIPLAPLHQPHNLGTIRAIMDFGGDIAQVACFDTSFHSTCPGVEQRFALPNSFHEEGIRRYGFHGLSYEYISRRVKETSPEIASGKVIVAHLGSGASMCGMVGGISRATSMGFSAMDGLVMGTRPGSIDPGVILFLIQEKGYQLDELNELLYRKSGLLGLSGISNDMRILLSSDAVEAQRAIDVFIHRITREIGALTAVLGGLDALIFTAGIGENSAAIRQRIASSATWLGVELDQRANAEGRGQISSDASSIAVLVVPTDEELMIATHTRDLLLR